MKTCLSCHQQIHQRACFLAFSHWTHFYRPVPFQIQCKICNICNVQRIFFHIFCVYPKLSEWQKSANLTFATFVAVPFYNTILYYNMYVLSSIIHYYYSSSWIVKNKNKKKISCWYELSFVSLFFHSWYSLGMTLT